MRNERDRDACYYVMLCYVMLHRSRSRSSRGRDRMSCYLMLSHAAPEVLGAAEQRGSSGDRRSAGGGDPERGLTASCARGTHSTMRAAR